MARMLDADVITTDVNRESVRKLGYEDIRIHSLGQTTDKAPKKQVQTSLKFFLCRFPGYDFYIFSGNYAPFAAFSHKPNLWYCHTPTRAFYDLRDYILKNQRSGFHYLAALIWIEVHSFFERIAIRQLPRILANSKNIRERIQRNYHRDSTVLYPPVETAHFRCSGYGDFWLSVNRVYREKRIDLQIQAFRQLPGEKLVIAGGYSEGDQERRYFQELKDSLPPNVTLLGEVPEDQLVELYATCKGLICTAMHEDFGLTPVEAMASGKPVVAVNEGGYRETVTEETGILIEAEPGKIVEAVRTISPDPSRYRDACLARAAVFDLSCFSRILKNTVDDCIKEQAPGKKI
jgi:glycosyltransferase involved in cell wall biosynthesis